MGEAAISRGDDDSGEPVVVVPVFSAAHASPSAWRCIWDSMVSLASDIVMLSKPLVDGAAIFARFDV